MRVIDLMILGTCKILTSEGMETLGMYCPNYIFTLENCPWCFPLLYQTQLIHSPTCWVV